MYGYIYKTTNLLDKKIYIGQHKSKVFDPHYYGSGSWFRSVLKKYGKNNFICEIIEECESPQSLNEREIYWIEHFQSRNPSIGYNLAKGGEQVIVGCTDYEINRISELLINSTNDNIHDIIFELQQYGLKIYEKNEKWQPTSNNSNGIKMVAIDNSVVVSFYTKNQCSITKEYANILNCSYWKYNLMVEIYKIPSLFKKLSIDYKSKKIIPESKGSGRGTSGIFLETQKHTKSARIPINFN
ncbi:hypothetical protein J2Z53_000503 [Clostridium moniliforme]|uniref:GIY-YIG domain-containing protein n=1 Tax=Clostridium moniliforme TaxID=39489 RepID=A0ABS4EY56_9CLOT|nr:GIY-YIG nuclease family protein [Clostridium moniliforme]MBP1888924.1 hypothetical protein [Clostridium moniliforme]